MGGQQKPAASQLHILLGLLLTHHSTTCKFSSSLPFPAPSEQFSSRFMSLQLGPPSRWGVGGGQVPTRDNGNYRTHYQYGHKCQGKPTITSHYFGKEITIKDIKFLELFGLSMFMLLIFRFLKTFQT